MDSRRLVLFFVFSLSVLMLFDAWQRDRHPPTAPVAEQKGAPAPASSPDVSASIPTPSTDLGTKAVPSTQPSAPPAGLAKSDLIKVETDTLVAEISKVGGDIRRLEFKKQRAAVDKDKPYVLFQATPEHVYVAQSGLIGKGLPNHRTRYSGPDGKQSLAPGASALEVRLVAPETDGIKVTKVLRFERGSYVIDERYEIANASGASIEPFGYFQLVRDSEPPPGDSAMLPTFTGAAVYTDEDKFQKIKWSDIDKGKTPYPKKANNGWVAMLQHYFVGAWLPKEGTPREYYTRKLDGTYAAGVIVPVGTIAAGGKGSVTVPLYAGPQEPQKLAKLAPGLDLVVDFGWLTIIAVPLFWLLAHFHSWVGNWGVAIILLTVVIKLIFYPLSEASYRSMAKMRVLAPKMQRLKEQYGNDRQRMQQAMMELYKTERINPLGGCLPILVQIPVFIALYWVLLASVELRHAPFVLWIDDLASPDPWYVLPILMGISMIVQTRLNPEPPDPIQAKVMKIMPVAFSIFFFFFPAGLVLYWLVNNILSITQQWHITRKLQHAGAKRPRR